MRSLCVSAALAVAACGQPTEAPAPASPPAPPSLMEQALAATPEMQPVFGYQQLVAYLAAHPELATACAGPRGAESRGVVPDNVASDSVYAPHKGALVLSVQCGERLTTVRDDPRQHWLVVLPPGAAEPTIVNCANAAGRDQCPRSIPVAAP